MVELRQKSTIVGFYRGAHAGKLEGAEAEFRAATLGKGAGQTNHLPIDMLLSPNEFRHDEHPGRGTGGNTSGNHAALSEGSQQTIAGRVFARSIATFLGIPMPTVATGVVGYPKLTGGTTFSMQSPSGQQSAVAGTFAGEDLKPLRGTGAYEFRIEDAAQLEGIEDALRMDLREGIGNLLNHQVVNGNGTLPNVQGILTAVSATPTTNPGSADTFPQMVARLVGEVDGLYANGPRELRMAMRGDLYTYMASTFPTNDDSVSFFDYLSNRVGAITVNNILPAKTTNNDIGHVIVHRSGYPERAAVMPIWRNLDIVYDNITLADKGEIKLTAQVLFNFAVLADDAFANKKIRTS